MFNKCHVIMFVAIGLVGNIIAAQYDNLFSAAKDANRFLIVEVSEKGTKTIRYALPQIPAMGEIAVSSEDLPALRHSGKYLLPMKNGKLLQYNPPSLSVDDPERVFSLLARFKDCSLNDEMGFMKNTILSSTMQSFREIALKRLLEIGAFEASFDKDSVAYFRELYFRSDLSVPEKKLLLGAFAKCNFLQMEEVFVITIADERTAQMAGTIFAEKNPDTFAKLMLKNIANDTLWPLAVRQSELMLHNEKFMKAALTRYDYKNPKGNRIGFVPILLTSKENVAKNQSAIKQLLTNSENTYSYELYRIVGTWLNRVDPTPYQDEIKTFLRNNRNNAYVKDGIIYPSMLAALHKAKYQDGVRLSLAYFRELKKKNNPQLTELVCILFKKQNQSNPTLDELIAELGAKTIIR